jgi:hypothetical protein
MQKNADNERTDAEAAMFKAGLSVMSSLYASLIGTTVLMQRHVPPSAPHASFKEAWNSVKYEQRGWVRAPHVTRAMGCTPPLPARFDCRRATPPQTNFERGLATMAVVHVSRAVSQLEEERRPIPEMLARARLHRAKLIDISIGPSSSTSEISSEISSDISTDISNVEAAALDTAVRLYKGSGSGLIEHLNGIDVALESAKFTNDADRRQVKNMLFTFEWTMHAAVEKVLASRSGAAALTKAPTEASSKRSVGSQLAALVSNTSAAASFIARLRVRVARGATGEDASFVTRLRGLRFARDWAKGDESPGAEMLSRPSEERSSERMNGDDEAPDAELLSRP